MNNAQNNDSFCVLFVRASKGAVHALGIEYICTFITLLGGLKHVLPFFFAQILPYQMHCLVDPGSKVRMCVCTIQLTLLIAFASSGSVCCSIVHYHGNHGLISQCGYHSNMHGT